MAELTADVMRNIWEYLSREVMANRDIAYRPQDIALAKLIGEFHDLQKEVQELKRQLTEKA